MKKQLRDFTLGELTEICGREDCDNCPLHDFGDCETFVRLMHHLDEEYEVEEIK